MASISRQMRRAKNDPLPLRFESRGMGLSVTVTLEPKRGWVDETQDWPEGVRDELWDEEPEFGDDALYDPELTLDQARWVPRS